MGDDVDRDAGVLGLHPLEELLEATARLADVDLGVGRGVAALVGGAAAVGELHDVVGPVPEGGGVEVGHRAGPLGVGRVAAGVRYATGDIDEEVALGEVGHGCVQRRAV